MEDKKFNFYIDGSAWGFMILGAFWGIVLGDTHAMLLCFIAGGQYHILRAINKSKDKK